MPGFFVRVDQHQSVITHKDSDITAAITILEHVYLAGDSMDAELWLGASMLLRVRAAAANQTESRNQRHQRAVLDFDFHGRKRTPGTE